MRCRICSRISSPDIFLLVSVGKRAPQKSSRKIPGKILQVLYIQQKCPTLFCRGARPKDRSNLWRFCACFPVSEGREECTHSCTVKHDDRKCSCCTPHVARHLSQKRSGDPNPQYFSKSTAVQMGGVLQYKWEVHCGVSLSSKLRNQESTAIQMGGVLPYKLEVYCRTF